jgi:ABC-type transporter Mla MlaB component
VIKATSTAPRNTGASSFVGPEITRLPGRYPAATPTDVHNPYTTCEPGRMMADVSQSRHRVELVLSGAVTVDSLQPVKHCLLQLLGPLDSYDICGADVSRMDAEGAELLQAFVTEIAERGATVRWVAASRNLIVAARALGMDARLGLSGKVVV